MDTGIKLPAKRSRRDDKDAMVGAEDKYQYDWILTTRPQLWRKGFSHRRGRRYVEFNFGFLKMYMASFCLGE